MEIENEKSKKLMKELVTKIKNYVDTIFYLDRDIKLDRFNKDRLILQQQKNVWELIERLEKLEEEGKWKTYTT